MSNSVRPHRWQPTQLSCPWDSPGKNTGVGCHFLLQCTKVKSESEVFQLCPTPSDPMDCSLPGSSIHGTFLARGLEWVAIAFSIQLPTQSGAPPVKFHFLGRAASLPDTAELHTAYPPVLYSHPAQFPKSPSLRYSHSPPCGEPCFPMSSAFKEHVLL